MYQSFQSRRAIGSNPILSANFPNLEVFMIITVVLSVLVVFGIWCLAGAIMDTFYRD
jgi:hypothetical protein